MFVESMTAEEIIKETRRDLALLENYKEKIYQLHRRDFLLAKKYPVAFQHEWVSPATRNKWRVTITCHSKKTREAPEIYHYSPYVTSRGVGVIFPFYDLDTEDWAFSRFTGHFFSRYRNRYLIPNNLCTPGMDVIDYFIKDNISFSLSEKKKEDNSFTCCLKDGIALGIFDSILTVFRTFVSHDMLFRIQKRSLQSSIEYQKTLDDFLTNKLPNSYKQYCLQGRVGRVAGPEPIPHLSLDDVKDLLKDKPKIPLFSPLTGKIEFED